MLYLMHETHRNAKVHLQTHSHVALVGSSICCHDRSEVSFAVSFGYRSDNNTPPPIRSPFLEVTFQMAVPFYRCALREGSAKQAFCQRLKLASRGHHREVA